MGSFSLVVGWLRFVVGPWQGLAGTPNANKAITKQRHGNRVFANCMWAPHFRLVRAFGRGSEPKGALPGLLLETTKGRVQSLAHLGGSRVGQGRALGGLP